MQDNCLVTSVEELHWQINEKQSQSVDDEHFKEFFWCKQVHSDTVDCCFSHKIGMPQHPATLAPLQYMSHQIQFVDYVTKDKRQKKIHVNMSRQIGLHKSY